jgi:hypothetical protein
MRKTTEPPDYVVMIPGGLQKAVHEVSRDTVRCRR